MADKKRRRFCIALAAAMLMTACASRIVGADASEVVPVDDDVWVILMAGQSNMAGAGGFERLAPEVQAAVKSTEPNLRLVRKNGKVGPLRAEKSEYAKDRYGLTYAFGPEMLLGAELVEAYPQRKFMIIKTAQGGTSLYGAWSPNWTKEKSMLSERGEMKQNLRLYDHLLEQTRTALADLEAAGESYQLKGFGWFQGENDSGREISAISYKDNIEEFIASYRKDLDAPDLPFVLGQINNGSRRYKPGAPMVRKAIAETADADPLVAMIATSMDKSWSDYPKHSDNVHYNTEGQKRLGESYARAFIELWEASETMSSRPQ